MIKIKQLLVDLYGCKADLDNIEYLMNILLRASDAVGSTIVQKIMHKFNPVGVTVIIILAETHMSIHTWPEHCYAAVDVFFCNEEKDPYIAWNLIREALSPESYNINELTRSIGKNGSL